MDITNFVISNVVVTNFTNITNTVTNELTNIRIPTDWNVLFVTICGVLVIFASARFMWKSVDEMKKQYIQNEKNKQQEQDFQIYFQILQPLFQRFNDTVAKHWGEDKNYRSATSIISIPTDFDYHTMVMGVSSIYSSIKDTLSILHVPEDSFEDINTFLSNMEFIACFTSGMPSYNTNIRDLDDQLKNYYMIIVFSSPKIFDYMFQIIGLYYLEKTLPQDDKYNIIFMVEDSENHKKSWEDKCNKLHRQEQERNRILSDKKNSKL